MADEAVLAFVDRAAILWLHSTTVKGGDTMSGNAIQCLDDYEAMADVFGDEQGRVTVRLSREAFHRFSVALEPEGFDGVEICSEGPQCGDE